MICRFCDFPILREEEFERTEALRIVRVLCTHCAAVVERMEYVIQPPSFEGAALEARRNRNT